MDKLDIHIETNINPLNAGLFVSSGHGTHPTRIIDSYELIYVNSGVLEIFEETENFKLNAGNALILFPGRRHGGLANYSGDLSFYWIHFKLTDGYDKNISIPRHVILCKHEKLIGYFRIFLDEQENNTLNSTRGACLITLMLMELTRTDTGNNTQDYMPAIKAKNFIDLNFREKISTEDIASEIKCNPDYLGRIFSRKYSNTITEYIHLKKVGNATKKLISSTMNINEISEDCGFSDTVYFRRIFKRITGLTPARYRKMYSHIHLNTE